MDQLFKEFNKPNASVETVGAMLDKLLPTIPPIKLMDVKTANITELLEVCCYHAAYSFNGSRFEQYFSLLLANHYQPQSPSHFESMLQRPRALPLIGTISFITLGMQLLNLLVSNRTNQYHLLLCKLPPAVLLSSVHLRFVLQLEESLREGTFHRILAAKAHVPAPEYAWFVEGLLERIRTEIIQCLKSAYDTLSVQEAIDALLLNKDEGRAMLMSICQLNQWSIHGDVVHINTIAKHSEEFAAHAILSHNLTYAKQLESIL